MATTPVFVLRDGSGSAQQIVFSTNERRVFLYGEVDATTIDVQVSVNGGAFVSDPTLVLLDVQAFTFPNPASYPDGYPLQTGQNTIKVRALDILGRISADATATILYVPGVVDGSADRIPTGIKVRRKRGAVQIQVYKPPRGTDPSFLGFNPTASSEPTFLGFNFYASTSPAGTSGYFRLNDSPVTEPSDYDETVYPVGNGGTTWTSQQRIVRVKVSEEDGFGQELAVRLDVQYDTGTQFNDLRLSYSFESVILSDYVLFDHVRTQGLNADQFAGVSDSAPLYYVITGVWWDDQQKLEFETPFSQEVLGKPFVLDTTLRDLPTRARVDVVTEYVLAVQRVQKEISLIPGSVTRDVSIDPFSSEVERIWFLLDFIHRSQSFLTLMQIDDTNGDGESDPVASSAYKQALKAAIGLTTDSAVQTLIDTQFDKLAANCNRTRLPGRPAVGQVVGYTLTKPLADIPIPSNTIVSTTADSTQGVPAVKFRVGGTYVMSAATADAYYNFDTRRYEIVLDIVAETVGEDGNRPADQIKSIQGVSGLSVTNTEATVFGKSRESNSDLAVRSMLAYVSVDSGTEGGYNAKTAEQIGVIKAKIVKSGDALMMRDWDPLRKKHIGGKVDIWIQGLRERQVTSRFAFVYDIARDIRCQILDIPTLRFRVLDSRVTPDTPLLEILDNPSQGFGVRNVTLGQDYDLAGVVIEDYQTFHLNTAIPQPVTMIDDVITADYRFRSLNDLVFPVQPVRRVVSVVGESSGSLTPGTGYALYKTEDPLWEGESTIARDFLRVTQVGGTPSGTSVPVNDERHVMIGFEEEPLLSVGINTQTLRVFNLARLVEYEGPGTASPDYEVIEGTPTTPIKIVRTANSNIKNGETVSVDYSHDENLTVTYVVNDLLHELQRSIETSRHITADVLVKQSIQNSVEIETTVQLKPGADKDVVDPAVRTSTSRELNSKLIGQGSAQSDIIHAVDATNGVDFQVVPLARMAYADGSRRLRESLSSAYLHLSSLDIGNNLAFILTTPLQHPTTDGGGLETEHKGVFQDDVAKLLSATLDLVAQGEGAYIIGADGAVIQGYSDDATLAAEGYDTQEKRDAERLARTANHIVVALDGTGTPQDDPTGHAFTASYVVRGDSGAHDFEAADVEYLDLGAMTVTYRKG